MVVKALPMISIQRACQDSPTHSHVITASLELAWGVPKPIMFMTDVRQAHIGAGCRVSRGSTQVSCLALDRDRFTVRLYQLTPPTYPKPIPDTLTV